MPTQGYEEELRSERNYVEGLYARLDAERARVKGRYNTALRGNGEALMERDAEVRALAKEVKRLDVADNGLCFGRLDSHLARSTLPPLQTRRTCVDAVSSTHAVDTWSISPTRYSGAPTA